MKTISGGLEGPRGKKAALPKPTFFCEKADTKRSEAAGRETQRK